MKQPYSEMKDEDLIMLLREGHRDVEDYLLNKYKNLVRKKASSMYMLGADAEDLIQEGMIGLFKAMRDYDFGRDAGFFTFAELCITRQIYTAVQASGRKKHMPLNSYVSLYNEASESGDKKGNVRKLENVRNNPEESVIDKENVEYIEQVIQTQLSELERQALDLYLADMSVAEIAKVLSVAEKSADNALQRAKNKIKKAMDEK